MGSSPRKHSTVVAPDSCPSLLRAAGHSLVVWAMVVVQEPCKLTLAPGQRRLSRTANSGMWWARGRRQSAMWARSHRGG